MINHPKLNPASSSAFAFVGYRMEPRQGGDDNTVTPKMILFCWLISGAQELASGQYRCTPNPAVKLRVAAR